MRILGRGRNAMALLILLTALVLSSCGGPTGVGSSLKSTTTTQAAQYTSFTGAGCPVDSNPESAHQEISQSMNGAITACLRVGALSPGNYSVAIQAIGSAQGSQSVHSGSAGPASSGVGPPVELTLSPSFGKPGSKLEITGVISAPLARQASHAQICWDGCGTGLRYQGVPIKWVTSTKFTASIVVPAAPWMKIGEDKVTSLAGGSYKVSIACLTLARGCGLGGSEGSATYNLLTSSGSPTWCPSPTDCARLEPISGVALPGNVVKISGFAPLQSIIGSDHPYQFELKITPGIPPADEITFNPSSKGVVMALIGHASLTVGSPPAFATLGKVSPSAPIFDGAVPISENPANPGQIVWCSQGQIGISGLNGNQGISTSEAGKVLVSLGYGLMGAALPNCDSVALADGGSVGKIVLASFSVAPKFQAPPFVDVALQTADGGNHWTPVPAPAGAQMSGFAGFRYLGSSLQALFTSGSGATPTSGSSQSVPLVEMLKSGDTNWVPGTFQCPLQGPCVTFGPYVPGNCAMNGSLQSLLHSTDNGSSWAQPEWPTEVQSCWPSELVPISIQTELLISSSSQYFVRESVDGGSSWKVVSLPAIPGATPGLGFSGTGAEIQMLANGSLLATGERGNRDGWDLLNPGSSSWCPVKGLPAGVQSSSKYAPVRQLGDTLYWIPPSNGSNAILRSVRTASVKC